MRVKEHRATKAWKRSTQIFPAPQGKNLSHVSRTWRIEGRQQVHSQAGALGSEGQVLVSRARGVVDDLVTLPGAPGKGYEQGRGVTMWTFGGTGQGARGGRTGGAVRTELGSPSPTRCKPGPWLPGWLHSGIPPGPRCILRPSVSFPNFQPHPVQDLGLPEWAQVPPSTHMHHILLLQINYFKSLGRWMSGDIRVIRKQPQTPAVRAIKSETAHVLLEIYFLQNTFEVVVLFLC